MKQILTVSILFMLALANDMMSSFDFNQSLQQPLIEPGNFAGCVRLPATTAQQSTQKVTVASLSQEGNSYWGGYRSG